jgi:hypothetical protein
VRTVEIEIKDIFHPSQRVVNSLKTFAINYLSRRWSAQLSKAKASGTPKGFILNNKGREVDYYGRVLSGGLKWTAAGPPVSLRLERARAG